ncbi:MAG: Rpn family recombination-promoting nuclease/putative transposase [Cytophagales bacterium]|nr:Rpn family recombination-promoting nuclease/putative transposase [Cytophagales bacterium]
MVEKYINPFSDFGFKKLFGEEPNKDLLIDFLNTLLAGEQAPIATLTYLKTEHLGSSDLDRKVIFDLYCESERGEKFIVELQKAKQDYFKDRSLYYSTFAIQEQAQRGDWNFELKAVYTIGILNFTFDDLEKHFHIVKLIEQDTGRVFYNKLTYIYLELPKFNKNETELETKFDKWLYVLKNLSVLESRPAALQERVFERLFQAAEIAKMNPDDRRVYESSLKYYRDLHNALDTATSQGLQEGVRQVATEMKRNGEPTEKIMRYTGLGRDEIEKL